MNTITIGMLSSVVAEIFKLIPALRTNKFIQAVVAIIVTAVGTWMYAPNGLSLDSFMQALSSALVTYLAVLKPVTTMVGSPTQA